MCANVVIFLEINRRQYFQSNLHIYLSLGREDLQKFSNTESSYFKLLFIASFVCSRYEIKPLTLIHSAHVISWRLSQFFLLLLLFLRTIGSDCTLICIKLLKCNWFQRGNT